MTKEINRWGVLIGSVGVLLCTGAVYAFSVFAGPLSAAHGWTIPQVMMAFTINAAIGPIPTILGGILTDKGKAKWAILIGGILFWAWFCVNRICYFNDDALFVLWCPCWAWTRFCVFRMS